MPVMIRKMMARWRWPDATRTAVAVADTRPVAVSTSAVMPWRCSVSPTGPVVRSTAVRQRPSNMKLLVVRGPGPGSGAVNKSLPSGPRNPVGHPPGDTPVGPAPCRPPAAGRVLQSWSQAFSTRRTGWGSIPDAVWPVSTTVTSAQHRPQRTPMHSIRIASRIRLPPAGRAGRRRRRHRRRHRRVGRAAPRRPPAPPRSRPSRPTSTSPSPRTPSRRASTPSWPRTRARPPTPS